MSFVRTQEQLMDMVANEAFVAGAHRLEEPTAGGPGQVIGEVPYNPGQHKVSQINMASIRGRVMQRPFVPLVIPEQPLSVQLVLDAQSGEDDWRKVGEAKQGVMRGLIDAVWDAVPDQHDFVSVYYLGDTDDPFIKRSAEQIGVSDIRDLCFQGLTMVVSDFSSLHHQLEPVSPRAKALAVKVNHPADLSLPAGIGPWRLDAKNTVNTNKPRQLKLANEGLKAIHEETLSDLQSKRFATAGVVLAPLMRNGIDLTKTDKAIADGLKKLMQR